MNFLQQPPRFLFFTGKGGVGKTSIACATAIELAQSLGHDPRPFVVTVMFSATLAFATPIGYQTNMMVYGPGGYRFSDFTKVGVPLNIIVMLVASVLIPILWPL